MRWMYSVFVTFLLLTGIVNAQTWTTVPPPSGMVIFKLRSDTNTTWKYPFDRGCPAGVYDVSNVIIDRSQRAGTRSKTTRITAEEGWNLYAAPWNQPTTRDDVGIVWIVKCISVTNPGGAFVNGAEISYSSNMQPVFTIAPYSGDGPYLQRLANNWNDYRPLGAIKTGGRNTFEAPPPPAYANNFPNVAVEIGVCAVAESGETAMAATVIVQAEGATAVRVVSLGMMNYHWAQGTIGYHVYYRVVGAEDTSWKRVPAPHCWGTPTSPDDWLFQWYDSQPVLSRVVANAPTHQPVANPQSRLNAVQLALKNETGDFEVPKALLGTVQYDCFCPVVDEYGPGSNKQGRWIGTENVRQWKLVQQTSQSGHTYWPVVVISNQYSTWNNVSIIGQRGASAAVTWFSGLSGGQGFGTTLNFCKCSTTLNPAGVTFGAYVSDKCSRWPGDHTASELLFEDCNFTGEVSIGMEGNQTANVQFERTYALAHGTRRGCVCWSAIPNQLDFTGALYCDCYTGSVFRTPWILKVHVEKIWIDQGFDHLIDASPVNSVTAKFTGGKLNAWGLLPNLARIIEAQSPATLIFESLDVQMNSQPYAMPINNGQYNFTDLRFNLTNLSNLAVLREPTEQQTAAEWPRFMRADSAYPAGRPQLGYSLTIPAETVATAPVTITIPGDVTAIPSEVVQHAQKINGSKTSTVFNFKLAPRTLTTAPKTVTIPAGSITIPARTLTFNSITGRQNVRRQDWWADPILIPNP